MSAHTLQYQQFNLLFDKDHSHHGFVFRLYLTGNQLRLRRKLDEIKKALHTAGFPSLSLEGVSFPIGRQQHYLVLKSTARARRGHTSQEVQATLSELLTPFVADALARVDYDLAVTTPTDVVPLQQAITLAGSTQKKVLRPTGRKQHCTERTLKRRARRRERSNLEAARAAFADAGLPPVVLHRSRRPRSVALA